MEMKIYEFEALIPQLSCLSPSIFPICFLRTERAWIK